MPKTRDAFALRKYLKTILDPFVGSSISDYSLDFKEFFNGLFEDGGYFPPVENAVCEVEEIIKCKLKRIRDFTVVQSSIDSAELTLIKANLAIRRFDRHTQRLLKLDAKDAGRKGYLIDQYDYASKILENFESSLTQYYLQITKNFSKSFARQVGRRIRISRQMKGLSQDTVAKNIGVAAISLSTWERGEREPPLYAIYRLAKFLDVSLDFLFGIETKIIS